MSTLPRSRLFILGLDGSPLPLLQRLMAAGDLPNLARIFQGGSSVTMSSSRPDVSAVAWTSINTGMNPGKHGIYGFVDRKPGTSSMEIMTSAHVRRQTIWELASAAGRRAISMNVPLSFPPQHVNGVVVSDFLAPSLEKAVWPPAVLPTLQDMGYRIDTDPWVARQSLDAFIEDFKVTADKRAEAVRYFMDREQWDLLMVVFMETDRLHHFMWNYMEENHPVHAAQFIDAYRHVDRLAGTIVDKLSADDQLIILSDHGFTSLKKEVYLNVWLEQQGFLHFKEGQEKTLGSIEPGSRAYALDPGRIYVNLQGRMPGGSVSQSEASSVVSEVADGLFQLTDDDDGSRVVDRIFRADELYRGPERGRAPDLLVVPIDGYDMKGSFDSDDLMSRGKLVGMHKYDNATLFIRGRSVTVDHASVHDVLPTSCVLMGLDCPPDLDGLAVVDS